MFESALNQLSGRLRYKAPLDLFLSSSFYVLILIYTYFYFPPPSLTPSLPPSLLSAESQGHQQHARCRGLAEFTMRLRQTIDERGLEEETVFLVLDRAERLRESEATLLPALLKLSELVGGGEWVLFISSPSFPPPPPPPPPPPQCQRQVCVILISELVWEKFDWSTGWTHPLTLHFPNYTKGHTHTH